MDDRQGGLPQERGVEMLSEATFISMSVSIRGMTDHGASSQGFFKDFQKHGTFPEKSMEDSMPDPPTLTPSPPFHIGHKDSPQSRSESTSISQCDFDLPQVWFASSCWGHMLSSASCVA